MVEDFVLIMVERNLNVYEHDENRLWLDHLREQMNFDELQQQDLVRNVRVILRDLIVQREHNI